MINDSHVNKMVWLVTQNQKEFYNTCTELKHGGFNCQFLSSNSIALSQLDHSTPECIVIDSGNNFISSLEFSHQLKSDTLHNNIKIIIISSDDNEVIEMAAFDAGADDFLIKPIKAKVLFKRISRFARSNDQSGKSIIKAFNSRLYINKYSFTVFLEQQQIPVSRKEFELLFMLASQPGKLFTRDEIYQKVWHRPQGKNDRTIDVHILRLRKKIGLDIISTQKGIGYRFTG
jgi:two-component system, OmpR family, alkaline phosphatase synthesis response regulator PhoP